MINLSVLDSTGTVLANNSDDGAVYLVYDREYQEGDQLVVETTRKGVFLTLCLDNALPPATVFMKEDRFVMPVPFGESKTTIYAPLAFSGNQHRLMARLASGKADTLCNLAFNPFDHGANQAVFPHASATVETRNEAAFAARNAIDGEIANDNHGFWPYTSWGINCDPNAALTIHFGRKVLISEVVLFIRADFPHDAWWRQARITISDGWTTDVAIEKHHAGQSYRLDPRRTEWLRLDRLIKAEDPSPFPALTQIEIWGIETFL